MVGEYEVYLDWLDKKRRIEDDWNSMICPVCGHDLIAHYQMVDWDGELIDPKPRTCMECEGSEPCEHTMSQRKEN